MRLAQWAFFAALLRLGMNSPYFMRRVRPIDGSSGACCIDGECEASTA